MKLLDIAEVAARSGVKPSGLRYYEEKGLIHAATRHGLRRQYGPEVLQQLSIIALAKMAGFSLEEIARMFTTSGRAELPRAELQARSAAMLAQARQLEALADMVRHIAECPAPNHLDCPKFQDLLRMATRAQQEATAPSAPPKRQS